MRLNLMLLDKTNFLWQECHARHDGAWPYLGLSMGLEQENNGARSKAADKTSQARPSAGTDEPKAFKNSKSLADIDVALRALSELAGAEGECYRNAHGGQHRFDVGRSKTHIDSLEDWGPKIAEAAGCRIKLVGISEDKTLVQGYLDADNWAIDEMGIAAPYADGTFDPLPGDEHRPSWMPKAPPRPAPAAPAPSLADDEPEEAEEPASAARKDRRPRRESLEAPPRAEQGPTLGGSRPLLSLAPGAAMGLARALVDCGLDPDELMLALAKVSRDMPDAR
jgi:hypothetical protein